jgi:hypothetical protein
MLSTWLRSECTFHIVAALQHCLGTEIVILIVETVLIASANVNDFSEYPICLGQTIVKLEEDRFRY